MSLPEFINPVKDIFCISNLFFLKIGYQNFSDVIS